MIQNIQDEIYQLENKQKKNFQCPENFFKVLESQNIQNQTTFELDPLEI